MNQLRCWIGLHSWYYETISITHPYGLFARYKRTCRHCKLKQFRQTLHDDWKILELNSKLTKHS